MPSAKQHCYLFPSAAEVAIDFDRLCTDFHKKFSSVLCKVLRFKDRRPAREQTVHPFLKNIAVSRIFEEVMSNPFRSHFSYPYIAQRLLLARASLFLAKYIDFSLYSI
jgi:hypothetical protein